MLFIVCHSISFVIFAVTVFGAARKVFRRRKTAANAWLLTFAYLSLSAFVLWAIQYVILLIGSVSSVQRNVLLSTGLWLGVMQNVVWIVAIFSLHSKHFSRVSLAVPLLVMISIVLALIAYQTTVLASGPFNQIDALAAATIFILLGISIVQFRVTKLSAAAFFIHGYSQWIWRYLWFTPLAKIQIFLFPFWHIALLVAWIGLISELLVTFRVMISSTVKDLAQEREAADRAIRTLNLEGFRAETIGSRPYTPKRLCAVWAEQCNVFILIIGERYGHIIKSKGRSVVEFEYDVAHKHDPGKILVYVKDGVTREPKLQQFLNRLEDFEEGYVTSSFTNADDLRKKIECDVSELLATQVKPKPINQVGAARHVSGS